jgi:transcriptional antiterminator NusG
METKWYVIRTVTGKERKAKEQLDSEFKQKRFNGRIKQVVIPLERVIQTRKGKSYTMERNYYPGYILIETDPSVIGELKDLNKRINNVVGFLGDPTPIALRPKEVDRILGKMDELAMGEGESLETFTIGESVSITDGPFLGFVGVVEESNVDKRRLKLGVKVFGRNTPIELDYTQVDKEII